MARKRKSLAEELANLADPTPTGDFDPEDLDFRTDNAGDEGVVQDDSDDGDKVRPIEVGRSALRMANAMSDPSLKQGIYAGTVRKRQRTAQTKFGDDVNETEGESSEDEEHEGEKESEEDSEAGREHDNDNHGQSEDGDEYEDFVDDDVEQQEEEEEEEEEEDDEAEGMSDVFGSLAGELTATTAASENAARPLRISST
eukprot:g1872.t1